LHTEWHVSPLDYGGKIVILIKMVVIFLDMFFFRNNSIISYFELINFVFQAHANDLLPILQGASDQGKSFVEVIGDNGPDMDPTNYMNIFFWGRLWRDTKLTRMSCISYPAGHSAFNPIEHAWSPLSNSLTSVTLPATLPGEDRPPNKQTELSPEEIETKNKTMLHGAAKELASHWERLTYDGNAIVPLPVEQDGVYTDHSKVEEFINAPLRDLDTKEMEPYRKEFIFFCKHIDRRRNAVSFMKCQLFKNDICNFCRENPPKECPAFEFEKSMGGLMFDPVPSDDHEGHFKTYLQMNDAKYQPDTDTDLGRCSKCVNWYFTSITEMQRHRRLLHPKIHFQNLTLPNSGKQVNNLFSCTHKINGKACSLSFPTYHQLNKHKEKSGHKRKRAEKAKKDAEEKAKKSRKVAGEKAKIKSFFQKKITPVVVAEVVGEEENEENEENQDTNTTEDQYIEDADESCAFPDCDIDCMKRGNRQIVWVACDSCDDWWHAYCVNGVNKNIVNFVCNACK